MCLRGNRRIFSCQGSADKAVSILGKTSAITTRVGGRFLHKKRRKSTAIYDVWFPFIFSHYFTPERDICQYAKAFLRETFRMNRFTEYIAG